ncbi:hypothetical protein [Streptomyces sp. CdTB01]|uniref:hypothetical protein n=1 Tax=Streptomyces sp. CdTB01 TaxID=1725411 RepID=UPI00073AACDF|nr:hypothetical protein [Streptomyces sp. CdTB01]ALV32235.1 hypothetical protein AS200_09415 [Streptomyces sp. CdTB01]
MRRIPIASALATVVVSVAAMSGCSSAASASAQDASADVKVGVCASGGPFNVQGHQLQSANCAITVNNRAESIRAYTINLTCTSAKRTPFAAGSMLYYVPAGQHTLSSAGIFLRGTDQNIRCQTRSASVRELTSADGSPEPWPSPSGALADAVAAVGPDATPTPEDTVGDAAASVSAQAEASQSAAAAASASASAALRHRALARTYTLGDYTVNLTNADPSGYDINDQQIYIAGTVTSHSSDTGTMKQFGLVVTLLRANGSVDASGTLCVELMGGTSDVVDTTTEGGTPDWISIRITRSPTTPC